MTSRSRIAPISFLLLSASMTWVVHAADSNSEIYGKAMKFAEAPITQGGLGFKGEEASAFAADASSVGAEHLEKYIENYRKYFAFARESIAGGGLGLKIKEAQAAAKTAGEGWSREFLATTMTNYKKMVSFSLEKIENGGLGLSEEEAKKEGLKATDGSTEYIEKYIRNYQKYLTFLRKQDENEGKDLTALRTLARQAGNWSETYLNTKLYPKGIAPTEETAGVAASK